MALNVVYGRLGSTRQPRHRSRYDGARRRDVPLHEVSQPVGAAELLNGLRPILLPSNWSDAPQKVRFMEGKWMVVQGGHAALEIADNTVYLLMSVRNAGAGVAVLHGWHLPPDARAPLAPV